MVNCIPHSRDKAVFDYESARQRDEGRRHIDVTDQGVGHRTGRVNSRVVAGPFAKGMIADYFSRNTDRSLCRNSRFVASKSDWPARFSTSIPLRP